MAKFCEHEDDSSESVDELTVSSKRPSTTQGVVCLDQFRIWLDEVSSEAAK